MKSKASCLCMHCSFWTTNYTDKLEDLWGYHLHINSSFYETWNPPNLCLLEWNMYDAYIFPITCFWFAKKLRIITKRSPNRFPGYLEGYSKKVASVAGDINQGPIFVFVKQKWIAAPGFSNPKWLQRQGILTNGPFFFVGAKCSKSCRSEREY